MKARRGQELALLVALVALLAPRGGSGESAEPRDLLVFAAASLTDAVGQIATAFERETGTKVRCSFAGSNILARQIEAGAPADLFVSASPERMDELVRAGLVRPHDRVDLLSNRLVVIVAAGSRLPLHRPEDLARVRTLALVPAGIYARRWLVAAGLWDRLRGRVVPTLDVRAALVAVDSGAAEVGIVYRTDARMARSARVAFEVPATEAPRIVYPAAVLARASAGARLLFDRLRSARARVVFERHGFEVLGGS